MSTTTAAFAVLDTFTTTDGDAVSSVTFTVRGGASHNERRDAALDALEAFTERTDRAVPVMFYETRAAGWGAVEFRFSTDIATT